MQMNDLTLAGIAVVFGYSAIQILTFYGVSDDVYGVYIMFYLFLICCVFVLPKDILPEP